MKYLGPQNQLVEGRKATLYAVIFTTGLFITIAVIGIVCSLLGRMLGDVGPYWTIAIGLLLIWVALDMLGVAKCSLPGGLLARLTIKGLCAWPGLRYVVRILHLWFHRPDTGHCLHSGQGIHWRVIYFAVRYRPLHPHCDCRQFDRYGQAFACKQQLATGQQIFPALSWFADSPARRIFCNPTIYLISGTSGRLRGGGVQGGMK